MEEVLEKLEGWLGLRESKELEELCLEVGLSRRQVHAWLRRRKSTPFSQPSAGLKNVSPASNIEVIALEEESDDDDKAAVTVKPSREPKVAKDYKQLYEEKSEELRAKTENLKNYENIMIDVEKCVKDSAGEVDKKSSELAKVRKLLAEEKEANEKEVSRLKEKMSKEEARSKTMTAAEEINAKLLKQMKEESLVNGEKMKQMEKERKIVEETNKKLAKQIKDQIIVKEKEKQAEENNKKLLKQLKEELGREKTKNETLAKVEETSKNLKATLLRQDKLLDKTKTMNVEVKTLKSKLETKESELVQKEKLVKTKEAEIANLKVKSENVESMRAKVESLKGEIDQKNGALKSKEKELKAHRDTLAVRTNAIKQLERKVEAQEGNIKERVSENDALAAANAKLETELKEKETKQKGDAEQMDSLIQLLQKSKTSMKKKNEDIIKLKQENQKGNDDVKALEKVVKENNENAKQLKDEIKNVKANESEIKEMLVKSYDQIEDLEKDEKVRKVRIEQMTQKLGKQEKETNDAKREASMARGKVEEFKEQLIATNMKVKEKLFQFRDELAAKEEESRMQKLSDEKEWKRMVGKCNLLRKKEQTLLDRESGLKEKVAKLKVQVKEEMVKSKTLRREKEEQAEMLKQEKEKQVEIEHKKMSKQLERRTSMVKKLHALVTYNRTLASTNLGVETRTTPLPVLPITFEEEEAKTLALTYLWPVVTYSRPRTFSAPTLSLCLISTIGLIAPRQARKRAREEETDLEQIGLKKIRRRSRIAAAAQSWPLVAWVPLPHLVLEKKYKAKPNFELTPGGKLFLQYLLERKIASKHQDEQMSSLIQSPAKALPSFSLSNLEYRKVEETKKVKVVATDNLLDNVVQVKEIKKVDDNFANVLFWQPSPLLSITYCWPLVAWTNFGPTIPSSKVKEQTSTVGRHTTPTPAPMMEKVKVNKRKGDDLESERKRRKFSAITYCWPILPWVAPATHAMTRRSEEEEAGEAILIVENLQLPTTPIPAAKTLELPIIPLPLDLLLLKMLPRANPARKTKSMSLKRKVEDVDLVKVEERLEEAEGVREMKELGENEEEKVPLLRLTYCWPILPYTKPTFIQSAPSSRGDPQIILPTSIQPDFSPGSKRCFSHLATSLTCQLKLKQGWSKKVNLGAAARSHCSRTFLQSAQFPEFILFGFLFLF